MGAAEQRPFLHDAIVGQVAHAGLAAVGASTDLQPTADVAAVFGGGMTMPTGFAPVSPTGCAQAASAAKGSTMETARLIMAFIPR
ncbi:MULTISPECIES: hypothetical protein [unclassified Brevundimonas]|uniref:hypothetical protein n=1 Tax=Brevundimonas sp. EYE_349 TaxID=2853455 RepID=UPI002002BFB5|nr:MULTISPECIES: hypothetical protein [unclassified Brevundimonas]